MLKPDVQHILEELNRQIDLIAGLPQYQDCFGVEGCDLENGSYYAFYTRQSLEEQSLNNRLPEYLRTGAQMAQELGVVVPREYILYDTVSGEHLERPAMIRLRRDLLPRRRIAGVLFPSVDQLTREPVHLAIFEIEAKHYGIAFHYHGAVNGQDPASEMTRLIMGYGAKFQRLANRSNNIAGNIGRTLKGWPPAGRAAYGYTYVSNHDATTGRVISASWELDAVGSDGNVMEFSPAWVAQQVYHWIGNEDRSTYWVARKLNDLAEKHPTVKPQASPKWVPTKVVLLVRRTCYKGVGIYNTATNVVNPDRPLTDVTLAPKRTLRRPKPQKEHVYYAVPRLVDDDLWQRAQDRLTQKKPRRVGRSADLQALCRRRIFCPKCNSAMTTRRDAMADRYPNLKYYVCMSRHRTDTAFCGMRQIQIAWLDQLVWERLAKSLKNPALVELQLQKRLVPESAEHSQQSISRWTSLIEQAQRAIEKIQRTFESGSQLYSEDEALQKVAEYRRRIAEAQLERDKLLAEFGQVETYRKRIAAVRAKLEALHEANIDDATFEERRELMEILDVRVYPSEDLSTVTVTCALDLDGLGGQLSREIINIASPNE